MAEQTSYKIDVINADKVARKLFGLVPEFKRTYKRVMREGGKKYIADIKRFGMSGRPGLISRTGNLKRSLFSDINEDGDKISLFVGSTSPYFKTHVVRNGTTRIVSKGKLMAVPMEWAHFGNMIKSFPSPLQTNFPGGFVPVYSRGGRKFLVYRPTNTISHTLRRSVNIPQRLDVKKISERFHKNTLDPEINSAIGRVIKVSGFK